MIHALNHFQCEFQSITYYGAEYGTKPRQRILGGNLCRLESGWAASHDLNRLRLLSEEGQNSC